MSGRQGFVAAAWVAFSIAAAGCSTCAQTTAESVPDAALPEQPIPAPAPTGQAQVHGSGLTLLPQSAAVVVRETPAGFRADPENARRVRSPWSAELRLEATDPVAQAGSKPRRVGAHQTHYTLSIDEEAGSGGPLHTLTASAACESRYIVLQASQQVEPPASPDWTPAWTLLASSGCAKDAGAATP